MRTALAAAATALLAAAAVAAPYDPEAEIAKALAGRTAGPPTDCISQQRIRSSRIIPETAILYEMNDGTIYLNRPPSGANILRRDLTLITDVRGSGDRLCNVDIVRLYDTTTRFTQGTIGLGQFMPYARPKP